jgi:hypothetical protein
VGGGIIAGLVFIAAYREFTGSAVLWLVAFGAIAGVLFGLSLCFNSHVKQWPILRSFLNEQAVQEAVRKNDL